VIRRRSLLLLLAAVALLATLGAPASALAARPDLTMTSDTTYDVQPAKQRVHVGVDLALVNHLKDTKTKRFYFDEAFLDVMPRASGFKLTHDGKGTPSVRAIKRTKTYTRLRLRFPRLYSGKTAHYRLTFDMKDPGGSPTRDLRVGDSLVSFPVWAFATDSTPGGSVRVTFPAGYKVDVEAGSIKAPTTDDGGRTIFSSGRLADPLAFFAYLVGDRPGAYRTTAVDATVLGGPADVVVRSWPDDAAWAKRVGGVLKRGLPALGERIGLAWPHTEPLTIQEAVSRSTDGYAGLFDPRQGLVEIAYYADDFVVLHEAAHGWFNGTLLADRWSNEAFASYYAAEAAGDLKVKVRDAVLTDEMKASKLPLNAWGPVGREDVAQEDYAYAAALTLARAIAKRAGDDGLQAVWADAAAGIGAYQPATGAPERVGGPPDWRGLLDLLEARTGASFDDLWRTWVARPTDLPLLDARAAARTHETEVARSAGDWQLPRPIRDALRAWRFDDANALLDQAAAVLEARAQVEAAADAADLITPAGLRLAFEDADGFDDAAAEAAAELTAITAYSDAVAVRPSGDGPFVQLGLWGETPDADLRAARDALATGDLKTSMAASAEAAASWSEAESIGQGRVFSMVLLGLAGLLAVWVVIGAWRRRHRRRFARGWTSESP